MPKCTGVNTADLSSVTPHIFLHTQQSQPVISRITAWPASAEVLRVWLRTSHIHGLAQNWHCTRVENKRTGTQAWLQSRCTAATTTSTIVDGFSRGVAWQPQHSPIARRQAHALTHSGGYAHGLVKYEVNSVSFLYVARPTVDVPIGHELSQRL